MIDDQDSLNCRTVCRFNSPGEYRFVDQEWHKLAILIENKHTAACVTEFTLTDTARSRVRQGLIDSKGAIYSRLFYEHEIGLYIAWC